MKKLLKIFAIILLAITVTACGSGEYDENGDTEESEEVTQGMEQYWMEQREEFMELAQNQVDEWKAMLEEAESSETVDEINRQLSEIEEMIEDIEQAEEYEWEDERDEIAEALNNLRSEIENLE